MLLIFLFKLMVHSGVGQENLTGEGNFSGETLQCIDIHPFKNVRNTVVQLSLVAFFDHGYVRVWFQ